MRNLLIFMAMLLFTLKAHATTIVRVPLEELARVSALVVQGRVEEVKVKADVADERRITTEITIAVMRTLKGHTSGPRLKLSLPGGKLGQWDATIPGMPTFTVGEEVILFLEATSAGFIPSGLVEGAYRLIKESNGMVRARRDLSGARVLTKTSTGLVDEGEVSHADDELSLDELVRRVRSVVGGAR